MAAARRPIAMVAAGLAVAVATAGCATTVTGSPRAATTLAPSSSTSSTASQSAVTVPSTTAPTTGSTGASTTAESSGIRPMPPLGSSEVGTTTATTTATGTGTIAGVDLSAVLSQLARTHVASVDSRADIGALTSVVDGARAKGLRLSVVSIGRSISNADTSAISRALFASTGGTLVVLSPTLISARTDQLTDSERDAAIKAAAKGTNDVESVTQFVASALKSAGLSPTTTSKKPPATTAHPSTHAPVGGVNITAVVESLGSDHIDVASGVKGVTAAQIRPDVAKAWKAGLKVYVAILAKDPPGHLYDVSSAVMDVTGGTVLVVSPKRYALSSDSIDDATLQRALDSAAKADTYQQMVAAIIATLLKK